MFWRANSYILASSLILVSCGGSSGSIGGGGINISNGITDIVDTVTESVNGAADILDTSVSFQSGVLASSQQTQRSKAALIFASVPFGSDWDETTPSPGIQDPRATGGASLLNYKDYLGVLLDEESVSDDGFGVSPFARVSNTLQIFCAIGVGAAAAGETVDDQGYMANGTYTIVFSASTKSAMNTTCGIDVSDITDGASTTVVVTSGSSNYDKKYSFSLFNQDFWVKNDSSVLRIASAENADSGGYSRTLVEINKSTNVTRAEYVWVTSNEGVEVYRVYFDETNDEGMVLSFRGSASAITTADRFIVSGKPSTGDALSLSFRKNSAPESANSYEACVNASTGDIITTGSESDGNRCQDVSRLPGADIDDTNTIFSNFFTAYVNTADTPDWGLAEMTDADVIGFTSMTNLPTTALTP